MIRRDYRHYGASGLCARRHRTNRSAWARGARIGNISTGRLGPDRPT